VADAVASEDEINELHRVDPHRRKFLKGFLGAAFVAPVVASFALDGVASAEESLDHRLPNQGLPNQLLPNRGDPLQSLTNQIHPMQILPNQHHPHK
jgi:hypothetical protein